MTIQYYNIRLSFGTIATNGSILVVGSDPGSASGKVPFFTHLRFLLQQNKKKYHSRDI